MKKILPALITAILLFPLAALAVSVGDYAWGEYALTVEDIDENPMLTPADMASDEHAVTIRMGVPQEVWKDEALSDALFEQARLVAADGTAYAPSAAMIGVDKPTLYHTYALPKGVEADALTLQFGAAAQDTIPEEFVGDWAGSSGNIFLSFTVNADGTGRYTFEQSGYTESYDVVLSAESETFAVSIPENNQLNIATCEGTYQYADGILTLDVRTTFVGGRVFTYTIPCERVEKQGATDSVTLTTAEGETIVLTMLAGDALAAQADDIIVHTRVGTTIHHSGSQFIAGSALKLTHMAGTKQYGMPKAVFGYESGLELEALADALGQIAQTTVLSLNGESYPVQVAWITAEMACFIFDCPELGDAPLGFVDTEDGLIITALQ